MISAQPSAATTVTVVQSPLHVSLSRDDHHLCDVWRVDISHMYHPSYHVGFIGKHYIYALFMLGGEWIIEGT